MCVCVCILNKTQETYNNDDDDDNKKSGMSHMIYMNEQYNNRATGAANFPIH